MRTAFPTLAALLAAGCLAPALAQQGNPAGTRPATPVGQPAPQAVNDQDRLFVQLVGAGGTAEVDAARLADSRARAGAVKAFAGEMAHDHGPANERLAGIARRAAIPLPAGLDPDHEAMERALAAAPAERFDLDYLRGQLVEHQKTVQLLEWEVDSGQDPELQRFAADSLPTVLDHLRQVRALIAASTGAPAP